MTLPLPPINTLPLGLLSQLGIKNGGVNPRYLADALQGVLDLGAFYQAQTRTNTFFNSTTFNVNGVGGTIGGGLFVVPAGEVWLVEQCGVYSQAALPAGVTMSGRAYIGNTVGQGLIHALDLETAGPGQFWLSSINGPLVLVPGYTFGAFIQAFAGVGPVAMGGFFTGTILKI